MGRGATRVAIYARVSTGEQSPELQLRELRDYAGRRGFAVHREYVDQASGDVRRRQRAPEFDALMADARRRRFDCVLVWKYDRFARSLGALIAALQEFRDLGVDFISHTQAIDTTTPMGRLFFHVIGSFAEFEPARHLQPQEPALLRFPGAGPCDPHGFSASLSWVS